MAGKRRFVIVAGTGLFVAIGVALSQSSPLVTALRFGELRRIDAPGRVATLEVDAGPNGGDSCPVLQLRLAGQPDRKPVLPLCRTAQVGWAPDGKAFFVNDQSASNSTLSYVFDVPSMARTEIAPVIRQADPEAAALSSGHAYFDIDGWEGPDALLVRLHGHTDSPAPVQCFVLQYRLGRNGVVTRLSRTIAEVTNSGCGE